MNHRFVVALLCLCMAGPGILLSGCGTGNIREQAPTTDEAPLLSLSAIPARLTRAKEQPSPQREAAMIHAARSLLKHKEYDWARNVLSEVDKPRLKEPLYADYAWIEAELAIAEGDTDEAKNILWDARLLSTLDRLSPQRRVQFAELRATLLYDLGEFKQSIEERSRLDRLLDHDRDQQELNQDLIWNTLMQMSAEELSEEAQRQKNVTLQGWYRLGALSKNNQSNLRQQLDAVDSWAANWPGHPASQRRPADLQLLKQLVEEQPQQIAVILPLSGKLANAGKAIRDGMMASFYHARSTQDFTPSIRFYDSQANPIAVLYDRAINEGAALVIGPLDKGVIKELLNSRGLQVPTLALNYIDVEAHIEQQEQDTRHPPSDENRGSIVDSANDAAPVVEKNLHLLYQFGLAVEDEAESVAMRAWRDGHRQTLILAPEGEWGSRSVQRFSETWLALGGRIINDYRFQNQRQYSALIADALDISQSQDRARQITRLLGQKLEFEPRRRADIDFIFMVAHPAQAQQLKPILAFHYARSIPVYSISYVYNGVDDVKANQDLNGIRFASYPWFFMQELPEKIAIDQGGGADNYQRLYAMGVDAYHLYPRLKQLERINQARFYGATGSLSLTEQRRIKREPQWAMFTRGKTVPMPKKIVEVEAHPDRVPKE